MPEQRHIYRLNRSLVVVIPPAVLKNLVVGRGDAVYWHVARGGEAILTRTAARKGGRPEGVGLERKLAAAEAELIRVGRRNEARDRTMYAEGYNAGYITAQERLTRPLGKSAELGRRRRLYAYAFQGGPPPKSKKSGQSRASGEAEERHTPDPLPSPGSSGGADASGAASPQASQPEITVQHL